MTTNLVIPTELELRLGQRGGLADAAAAMEKHIAKLSGNPRRPMPRMSDADRARRLKELTLQLGSEAAAKSALAMEAVCPR